MRSPSTGANCGRTRSEDDTTPVLAHLSDDARHRVVALIADFRLELNKRAIGPRGRQVLDHLMPHLLSDVCSTR